MKLSIGDKVSYRATVGASIVTGVIETAEKGLLSDRVVYGVRDERTGVLRAVHADREGLSKLS